MRPRCKVTGKICYDKRREAEIAADRMALRNWQKGADTEMSVYHCIHCESLHVGTRASRPIHPWKTPLHRYRHLENPRPAVMQATHAGNFSPQEKMSAGYHDYKKPRPRKNKSRRPYPM